MENTIYKGQVIFFNTKRGYGFISWTKDGEIQKDLFVHFSDIKQDGFKNLFAKQNVEFCLGKNNNGIDKAIDVNVVADQKNT